MKPERWQRIEQMYHAALDSAPDQRSGFLAEACADDDGLRREVEKLLAANEQADGFLAAPALELEAKNMAAENSSPTHAVQLGQEFNHYRILSRVGAGGMGEVFLARDTILERRVALKLLPLEFTQNAERLQRFVREAKNASALNHPNIITIYEIGEVATARGNTHFIATEFIEGETLRTWTVDPEKRLGQTLNIAVQVASALDAAHKAGIVHRDIKPENVMVRPDGLVKVLDFGLAKLTTQTTDSSDTSAPTLVDVIKTRPGVILGTLRYMSPEQARGRSVDARSDIFSLGVVVYEMLTGQPLFAGESDADVVAAIIYKEAPPLAEHLSEVPAEVERIVQKALVKDAEQRYQNAGDFQIDLKNVQKHLEFEGNLLRSRSGVSGNLIARATSGFPLAKMLGRRRLFLPVALATLALALLAFFGVLRGCRVPYRPSADALHWYNKGTDALRDGAYYTASKTFEQAIKMDDKFALAHARLAEAYTELDYSERAGEEILNAQMLASASAKLPPLDVLYVQAISYVVLRKLAPAIQSYNDVVRQAPETERANAYLDLGRAYEKDDQLDKAKESYGEATSLAPQEAAAFLRLGTIYVQQNDKVRALGAFEKAEAIYRTSNNFEGVAETLYQRGVLLNNLGELAEARAQIKKAFNTAETNGNLHQQIKTRLEMSRAFYTGGDTAEAQRYASEAIGRARDNNMENLATQGLIELGNACRTSGNYEESEKYLKQALEYAKRYKDRRNEARSRVALGGLCITRHDAEGGLDYLQPAVLFYEEGGYRRDAALAYDRIGSAYELKGEYDAAIRAYEQQRDLAEQVGDQSFLALSHRRLGNVRADQERYTEALDNFNASYEIFHSLGNQLQAGYNLINRGHMLWRLGRYEDARTAFAQANSIAARPDDANKQMLARLSLLKAQMLLSERRFAEAKAEGNNAFSLNAENEHAVEAKCVVGLAQALSGATREGKLTCEAAIEMARHMVFQPLLPRAQLALAEAMLENGDALGALNTARLAQDSFARAGQQESEWRAWLVAARAALRTVDTAKAYEYAAHAKELLISLRQTWGEEACNDYLTRPDIQHSRKYLSQLLAVN